MNFSKDVGRPPFDGRGPQRGCAARPACARTGMGTPVPHAGAALAGTAPALLAGGGPPCGISRPFAPTLSAVQTARPPRLAGRLPLAPPAPAARVAYFYKPPQDGTSAGFLLTHADEPYMAQLRRAGYAGPILQVTAANEAEGPGPYANAHARCDASYPTYQRTVADRNGVFCRELHPHEDWFLHNLRGE